MMRAVAFWADDDDDLSAKNHLRRTARIRRPRCAGLLPRSTSIAKVPIGENGSLSGTSDSRFSCNSALSALALAFRLRNYLNGKLLWVAMSQSNHEFGGISTDLKLSLVGEYLHQFTTALRPQFENLWYIDAFAGTGERTVIIPGRAADMLGPEVDARVERRAGSAKIAIDVSPAFDRLVFMDKRPKHIAALNAQTHLETSLSFRVTPTQKS
jgi:hypothetical protein